MFHGHVMDELHDDHRLSHPCASEEADLPPFQVRSQEVYDLDPRFEGFHLGGLFGKRGGRTVDRISHLGYHRAHFIHRLSHHIQNPAQRFPAHGHGDLFSVIIGFHPPDQSVRDIHGHAADDFVAQVLSHFYDQVFLLVIDAGVGNLQRSVDRGKVPSAEFHVYHRSDNLDNLSDLGHGYPPS